MCKSYNFFRSFFGNTLFVLLLFLLPTGTTEGQTTVTIGSGSSTQSYVPFYGYYKYTWSATLFTKAEINSAGYNAIGVVSKLAYYVGSLGGATGTYTLHNQKIYIKHTTETVLTNAKPDPSTMTLVYEGDVSMSMSSTGWKEITLYGNFVFNNSNNIIIYWENWNGTSIINNPTFRYTSTSPDYMTSYDYSETSFPMDDGYKTTSRANIQITFSPETNMSIVSSTTEQAGSGLVMQGTVNQPIVRLKVVAAGTTGPINVSSITFNMTGTTSSADISNARVFYTTTTGFSTGTPYASTITNPSGTIQFNGVQNLSSGNNYFWLVYDISSGATENHQVDGQCTVFLPQDGGGEDIPSATNPAGYLTIRNPLTGIKTITAVGGDYTNFTSAIADLNLVGVGEGGVIFQIPDGETFNEVAPLVITATGTSSNNITFRQSGSGTKPVVSVSGTAGGGDAAFRLDGSDYVVFDGLDIRDAGQITGSTTDDDLEIGIFLKGQSEDGCRNNLVKNCIIDMNKGYVYSWGVYVYSQATSNDGKNMNNLFYNNTVQDCYMAYYFRGMSASFYDSGNEVGNLDGGSSVISNIGSNLGNSVYGIRMEYNQNFKVFNTSFSNFINDFAIAGIFQNDGGANSASYYGNTMSDFVLTVYTNDIIGIKINNGATHNIYSNHIYGFTTATGDVIGIAIAANSSTNTIYKNNIHDLSYTGTSYMQVMGIKSYSGSTNNIFNNFIYDLRAPSAIPSLGLSRYTNVTGIYLRSGGNYVFNNSVLINYTSAVASNESAALYILSNASTVDLRNNIFVNNSDVTTGARAVAIYRDNTTYTNLSPNSNNNIYYAGTPSAKNLIFYDRTNSDQTLEAYKTRMVNKDQNSVTENVPFLSTSGIFNLHLNPATPTLAESRALVVTTPFAVTDDIDGDLRSGTTPDIGADEGAFTYIDISPPVITYTLLPNTSLGTDRILTATITDATGVPTSGTGLPMLYWKINSGSWTGVQGVSIGSNQYTFTFGAGAVLNDVVSYYIVAQDLSAVQSVTCYPLEGASGFTVDPPAASTPPTSPSSYTIIKSLSGVILVGEGQTFTSLSQTGGLFDAINQGIITGNITVKITSDIIETGQVSLNRQLEEALYTLTIQPDAAVLRTIYGSVNQGMIRLYGARNVTIDGRFEGSGNYLDFYNYRYFSNGIAVQIISEGTGLGCNNITIRNCTIRTGTMGNSGGTPVYSYALQIGGVSSNSSGADNDNISIIDNLFTNAYYGILVKGSTLGANDNLVITGNIIGSETTSSSIRHSGISFEYCTGATVSQNTVFNILEDSNIPYGIIVGPEVTNSDIERNKIYSIKPTSMTTSLGGRGIMLSTSNSSCNVKVANNILYDIIGGSDIDFNSKFPTVGILVTSGGGYKIYNNSVNLAGSANRNAATISTCIYVGSAATDVDLRNNIFVNGIINTFNTGDKAYSIYSNAPNSSFTNINYNDYYVYTGGNYAGVLGYFAGDVTSLPDWRTASGQDVNSISANPDFKAFDNLKPMSGSPVLMAGTPVSGVTVDYFGDARSGTNPSIGAVENPYAAPVIDWANLQHPASITIKEGIVGQSVYARVYEPFVTNSPGQGGGIQCWIGYSTSNTNPNTWTNWISATFQGDAGNNDEYTATLGTNFAAGTYYYASRWMISEGAGYQYGGYSTDGGGFWDGSNYVSGVLTVEDNSITWANLQHPQSATIDEGNNEAFYARVYVPDVTTLPTISPSLTCWIGFNNENTDPSTWSGGVWIQADFNVNTGNNDEYYLAAGEDLPPGTYYYASRFRLADDSYVYGGFNAGGGNFWDGVNNVSGVLTIEGYKLTPPFTEEFENTVPPFGWETYEGILASPSILTEDSYTWYQEDWRNTVSSFGYAADVNIYSTGLYYWLVTPTISLGTGAVNFELRFDLSINEYGTSDPPELTGTDDKFAVVISTDNGVTWSAANTLRLWDNAGSPYVYNNISTNGTFTKIAIPLTGYTGDVKIGLYGESTVNNADNEVFVDNMEVRKIPNTSNSQTINAGVLEPLGFTGTGITLQFPAGNSTDLNLTIDKIEGNAGGTLPGGLLNLGLVYWNVTVNSGTVDGVYCLSADVSECGTVNDYSTLHLLKRDNANSEWEDIGVPTDVTGAPILKWCYPALNSFSEFGIAGFSENPLPVELASFTALVTGRDVTLNWSTKTEVSSNRFVVERTLLTPPFVKGGKPEEGGWESVGEVKASGNSNSLKEYSFTDKKLNSGKYNYRLKQIDNDGTFDYSEIVEAEIDVPKTFALNQNYPNPFNPGTVISYQLPVNSLVRLELFSITGEKVATLVNEELEAGYHNYNLSASALGLSSGVYIYRMIAGEFVSTKKLMLIK